MLSTRRLFAPKGRLLQGDLLKSLEKYVSDPAEFEGLSKLGKKDVTAGLPGVVADFPYKAHSLKVGEFRSLVLQNLGFSVTAKRQPTITLPNLGNIAAAVATVRGLDEAGLRSVLQLPGDDANVAEEDAASPSAEAEAEPQAVPAEAVSEELAARDIEELGFDPETDDLIGTAEPTDLPEVTHLDMADHTPVEKTPEDELAEVRAQLGFDPETDDAMPLDGAQDLQSAPLGSEIEDVVEDIVGEVPMEERDPAEVVTASPLETKSSPEDQAMAAEEAPETKEDAQPKFVPTAQRNMPQYDPTQETMALSAQVFSSGRAQAAPKVHYTVAQAEAEESEPVEEPAAVEDSDEVLNLVRQVQAQVAESAMHGTPSTELLSQAAAQYEGLRKDLVRLEPLMPHTGPAVLLHDCLRNLACCRMAFIGGYQHSAPGMKLDELFDFFLLYGRSTEITSTPVQVHMDVEVPVKQAVRSKQSMFPPASEFLATLKVLAQAAAGSHATLSKAQFDAAYTAVYPLLKNLFVIAESQLQRNKRLVESVHAAPAHISREEQQVLDTLAENKALPLSRLAPQDLLKPYGGELQGDKRFAPYATERLATSIRNYARTPDLQTTLRSNEQLERAAHKNVTSRILDIRRVLLTEALEASQGDWYMRSPVGNMQALRVKGYRVVVKDQAKGTTVKTGLLVEKGGEITWEVVVAQEGRAEAQVRECRMDHEWEHSGSRSSKVSRIVWRYGSHGEACETWHRSQTAVVDKAERVSTPAPAAEQHAEIGTEEGNEVDEPVAKEDAFSAYREVQQPTAPRPGSKGMMRAPPPPKASAA